MGNETSNTAKISNSVNNNFLTITDNTCKSTASVEINNVVGNVNLLGGKRGDINFANVDGTLTAFCSIDQQISQSTTAILKAVAEQEATVTNEWFNSGVLFSKAHNKTDISQSMVNNLTAISSNNCNSTASTKIANGVININEIDTEGGNIRAFSVGNDTTATCTISNLVGQESYADLQSKADQKSKTMGMFAAIAAAIVTMMIVGLIAIVVLFGGGALLVGGYKISGKKGGQPGQDRYSHSNPAYENYEEEGEEE